MKKVVIMLSWPNQLCLALRHLQQWQKKQFAIIMVLVIMTPYVMPVFVNSYIPNVPPKYIRTETVMGRKIFEFKTYRDGQLFRFEVPLDTRIATWRFVSNFTKGCMPGAISVFLQAGSYPVANPDGGRYPANMKVLQLPHNLTFHPENGEHSLLVSSPEPGDWFLLAYLNKKEKTDYVQETLDSRCSTWLHIKVEYQLEPNIIHLFPEKHNHQNLLLYHNIERPQTYRFYTGDDIWSAQVNITKCRIKSATDDASRGGTDASRGRGGSRNDRRPPLQQPPPSVVDFDLCPLQISVSPRRPPDVLDPKTRKRDCNHEDTVNGACSLDLYPEENSWHFITVTPTMADRVIAFAISVSITDCPHPRETINYFLVNRIDPNQICSGTSKNSAIQLLFPPYKPSFDIDDFAFRKCGKRVTLMRRTLPGIFSFEYELPTPFNVTETPQTLDLENELPSVLQFEIGTSDIGGSLSVELRLDHNRLSGLVIEKYILKACLSHGKRIIPRDDDGYPHRILPDHGSSGSRAWDRDRFIDTGNKQRNREFDLDQDMDGLQDDTEDVEEAALCPGGRILRLNVSATEKEPHVAQVLVPYPAAGKWFLTILPKCKRVITRRTQQDSYYDHHSQYCTRNSTPIQFRIRSDMCVQGSCGKYGRCYQFFSGGNMFSSCTCFAGYKGWGCTDEIEAVSEIDLLAATLLLCLSNLLYLPAIGLAIYRGFYTESFVYFANMLASTLYHACDQDVFSFCLMKYTVLQFCDFYTATMAYWVTVLAMGGLPEQAKSLLHMVGAVGVALAIEYDRTGVFTFLVPASIGIVILIASWISHCSSDRVCYPGLKYACCFFLPGTITIIGGLFMFVFLEREANYQFVHSAWHVSMAVAILFLLPKSPQEIDDDDEKYTILDTRPPSAGAGYLAASSQAEASFKHYPEGMENGPEVINMTTTNISSSGGNGTMRPASSMAALNNGGGGTLPRSSLVRNYAHGHGTLKKSVDELRPLTADGHYHGHSHSNNKPSMDTLRRVHFEKSASPSGNGAIPASPPRVTMTTTAPSVSVASPTMVTTTVNQPTNVVTTTAPLEQQTPMSDDAEEGDTAM